MVVYGDHNTSFCKRLGDVGVWSSGGVSSQTATDDVKSDKYVQKRYNRNNIQTIIHTNDTTRPVSNDTLLDLSQIILFNSELHENETPPNIHLDLETCSRDTATLDICLFLVSNTSFHPACIPNHTDNIAVSLSIVDLECLAQKKTSDSTPTCVPLESDNKCFP